MKPVQLLVPPDAHHLGSVAVGNEVEMLYVLGVEVVVFYNHNNVAHRQRLLAPEYAAADTVVIDIGVFVGAGYYKGLRYAHRVVRLFEGF